MSEQVTTAIEDHVAVVTLNRPEKHNALDMSMFNALGDAGDALAADDCLRAVIVEGAGANFCAGIDIDLFEKGASVLDEQTMLPITGTPANLFQRAAYVWRQIPVPVICAIQGVAFGAGLQIALGADLRYARPDSQWSIMEIKWGLVPDMAISTTIRHLLPVDKIKDLAWSGRVISGEEACSIGLVSALHDDPSAAAREWARAIAAKSPAAIRASKQLFNRALDMPESAALQLEAKLQVSLLGGWNQTKADIIE